jgi:hypothetical protein
MRLEIATSTAAAFDYAGPWCCSSVNIWRYHHRLGSSSGMGCIGPVSNELCCRRKHRETRESDTGKLPNPRPSSIPKCPCPLAPPTSSHSHDAAVALKGTERHFDCTLIATCLQMHRFVHPPGGTLFYQKWHGVDVSFVSILMKHQLDCWARMPEPFCCF